MRNVFEGKLVKFLSTTILQNPVHFAKYFVKKRRFTKHFVKFSFYKVSNHFGHL